MRTAATLLNPAAAVASFENVRFKSPLKIFKNDPFEAEVEVVRVQAPSGCPAAYQARITSWFVDRKGRKMGSPRTHHECRVVVAKAENVVAIDHAHWDETVWVSDRDVYKAFFHGPAFRFLDHLIIEGNGRSVRFVYRDTEQRPSMFDSPTPSGIEAIFQAAAGLALESRGVMALPTGIDQAIVHSAGMPYSGELVTVRTTQEDPESRLVFTFDGILRDRDGNALVELKGVEAVELEAAPGFPGKVFEQTVQVASIMKEMENSADTFLDSILHEEEVREHTRKMTPKRAAEWLAGRVAVKKSVQRILAASNEPAIREKGIRVLQDDQGKPRVELVGRPDSKMVDVSIAHSNGLAIAASAAAGAFAGFGVDVEKIETRSDAWVKDYFTDEEVRAANESTDKWTELTRMWCLKEAALKAMGTGLRFDLKDVQVASLDATGNARLEFRNDADKHLAGMAAKELEARVHEQDGLVFARVMIRK
jgi:phosphopantetheine--protein transferase-like protein